MRKIVKINLTAILAWLIHINEVRETWLRTPFSSLKYYIKFVISRFKSTRWNSISLNKKLSNHEGTKKHKTRYFSNLQISEFWRFSVLVAINFKLLILLTFACLVLKFSVQAQQNYPVSCTPVLTPPYTLHLSDYCAMGSQKLMIYLHANDLNISRLPVKLQLKIETTGITIETPPTLVTTPIYLDGGATTVLFGNDLSDYFNLNKLNFQGYSKEAYRKSGQLPEGFYRISISVLHYQTLRVISNVGVISTWIAIGKPPALKFPLNDDYIGENAGMPVTFSWLPGNVGSPAAMGNIQYRIQLWEMRIEHMNPNIVMATLPDFFEANTFNTAYTFYPNTVPMEPGMRYAWRVTASDITGLVPFEQNGESEIRTFIYKAPCDSVTRLQGQVSGRNGKFTWEGKPNQTSYNIELRNPANAWIKTSETYENSASFFNLDYGSIYEMRVQSVCNNDPSSLSDFTAWKQVKVPAPQPAYDTTSCPNCGCDDNIPSVTLSNFDLRTNLAVDDTISNKTHTTRLIIKEITGNHNGTYEGICLFWAEIWNLKTPCNFWNLQVNTDNVFVNLNLESINDPAFMLDVDSLVADFNELTDNLDSLFYQKPVDTLTVDTEIDHLYVNDKGEVIAVAVDDEGNITKTIISEDVDDVKKFMIKDADGKEYVVTNKGDVMGAGEYFATNGGKKNDIENYNKEQEENADEAPDVIFAADVGQNYGFDAYSEIKSAIQDQYPVLKGSYRPSYKSMAAFSPDGVKVSGFTDGTVFKDDMGIPSPRINDKLTLTGGAGGSHKSLYALNPVKDSTTQVTGKLNIESYTEETKKLIIVSVNGAELPDVSKLENDLNTIYNQSVTKWQVEEGNALTEVQFEGEKMSHGGSGVTSPYNTDQKTIINLYNEKYEIEDDACYLFFITEVVDKAANIAGYMPLNYNVGFIYGLPNDATIAHELGHGAFNLFHTFSDNNNIASEGSTQNLMDYTGGTELWKYQWDLIHDPQTMLFAFAQDESEGQYTNTPISESFTILFDNVFSHHRKSSYEYLEKINQELSKDKPEDDLRLVYGPDSVSWSVEEKAFMNQWKIRVRDANKDISDIVMAIQDAQPNEKIGKILARSKNIYLGKFTYEDIEYPVAIYGNGSGTTLDGVFTKVRVSNADELENRDKLKPEELEGKPIKYIYCDETPVDYMIIGFYEDEKSDPSLIMQIEKFDISEWQFTKEKWLEYLGILGEPIKYEITQSQLEEIFPNTDTTRLKEVMEAINNNSADFNINTVERMSHFLGQIGTETGGMKALSENECYSATSIKNVFGKVKRNGNRKYCDLFEGYDGTSLTTCPGNTLCKCNPVLPDSISLDSLTVKSKYICKPELFDYTYGCRMGNGAPSTKDGSKFKGKGFIQLTGKNKYKQISDEWNKMYPDDQKEFHGKDIDLLVTDIEIAMKASMVCWKIQGLNSKADEGMTNSAIDDVGRIVNGSGKSLPNGYEHRRTYTTSAYNALNGTN